MQEWKYNSRAAFSLGEAALRLRMIPFLTHGILISYHSYDDLPVKWCLLKWTCLCLTHVLPGMQSYSINKAQLSMKDYCARSQTSKKVHYIQQKLKTFSTNYEFCTLSREMEGLKKSSTAAMQILIYKVSLSHNVWEVSSLFIHLGRPAF